MSIPDSAKWDDIEILYISGDKSLRELAEQFSVSESAIFGQSVRKQWASKRKQYRDEKIKFEIESRKKTEVESKESFDSLTDLSCDIIAARISTALLKNQSGENDTEIPSDTLKDMATTLRTVQEIQYRRLGIAAPKQPIEHDFSNFQDRLIKSYKDLATENNNGNGHNGNGNDDGNEGGSPPDIKRFIAYTPTPPTFDDSDVEGDDME